jgi:hypothetical protein
VASVVVAQLMQYAREQSVKRCPGMDSFEVGEVFVVPALALVSEICTVAGACPPKPDDVEALGRFHLRLFDRRAPDVYGAELAHRRRGHVEQVFAQLQRLAASYWVQRSQN